MTSTLIILVQRSHIEAILDTTRNLILQPEKKYYLKKIYINPTTYCRCFGENMTERREKCCEKEIILIFGSLETAMREGQLLHQ